MKKATIICLCLVCVYCILSLTADAQNHDDASFPESILPDTALAVWAFPHFTTSFQHLTQITLNAKPYEPEESAITTLLASLEQQFQHNFGTPLSALAPLFEKTVAVALLDLLPSEEPNTIWPIPDFVFLADINGTSDAVRTLLEDSIIPSIQLQVPNLELQSEARNGIISYTLSHGKVQFSYTVTDQLFILGRSPDSIRQLMIPPSGETRHSSLFYDETYQAAYERIFRQKHDSRLYADVQRIWHRCRPFIRQSCFSSQGSESQLLFQLLDLYELTTLSWQASYTDDGGREKLFWAVSSQNEPVEKSFSLLSGFLELGNGILTSDRIISGKTLYYGVSRVDVLQVWHHLITLIETFLSPQQQEKFQSTIAAFERSIQRDVEQELLPSFGQELAFACSEKRIPSHRQSSFLSPEDFPCALFIQTAQQSNIEQILRDLSTDVSSVNPHQNIWTIHIPGVMKPIKLYAAFVRDFLVLSISRSVIQESLRVAAQGGSLASAPDYHTFTSVFPEEHYAKGYINLPRLFRRLPGISSQPASRNPSRGMMWVTTVEEGGFLTESSSPFGGIVTGAVRLWFGLALQDTLPEM